MPGDAAARLLAEAFAFEAAGRLRDALGRFARATEIDPGCGSSWRHRGNLLRRVGELGAAAECFERAMALGDSLPINAFFLSAVGVGPAAPVAPAGFVTDLFDQYADRFDDHLVGALGYRAPSALAALVSPSEWPSFDTAIDLGCGTGLAGAAFRSRCRTLTGVDLSARMLAHADRRSVYDELVHDEFVAALRRRPGGFDLAVCCDALIYVGDLTPVFKALGIALRPGGSFAFTIESTDADAGFDLLPSLRYAHSERYLHQLAEEHGFAVRGLEGAVLRVEAGEPVQGRSVHMTRVVDDLR